MLDLAAVAVWATANWVGRRWLTARFRDRPFGVLVPEATKLAIGGSLVLYALLDLMASRAQSLSWPFLAGMCVGSLPIPIWARVRRPRFPVWAPLPRLEAVQGLALTLVIAGVLVANWSSGWPKPIELAVLACLVAPVCAASLLRRAPGPEFSAGDRAQPWWPRTPGFYGDWGGRKRFWDGSDWLDEPGRARTVRRVIAWTWTAGFAFSLLLPEGGPTRVALAGVAAAALGVGTVVAWRSLARPLPGDCSFPPTLGRIALAHPGWLRDPDDWSRWRYWDGEQWTHSSPHPPAQKSARPL